METSSIQYSHNRGYSNTDGYRCSVVSSGEGCINFEAPQTNSRSRTKPTSLRSVLALGVGVASGADSGVGVGSAGVSVSTAGIGVATGASVSAAADCQVGGLSRVSCTGKNASN